MAMTMWTSAGSDKTVLWNVGKKVSVEWAE